MLTKMIPLFALSLAVTPFVHAEDSVASDVKEVAKDVKAGTKKAIRATDDAACESVHGKGSAKCTLKKGKHKIQNAADQIKE